MISGTPPAEVLVFDDYMFQPDANDEDGDTITFSIKNKPVWAVFDSVTGKLSGTPSKAFANQTFENIVIIAKDGKGGKAELPAFSITVHNAAYYDPVILVGEPATVVRRGEKYSFAPFTDYSGPGSFTFSIVNKPAWANFNTQTGKLSGIPGSSDIGKTADIVISASADNGTTSSMEPFDITVVETSASSKNAFNLLLQSTFGPTEQSMEEVMDMGIEGWIDAQLNAPSAYDSNTDAQLTYLERHIELAKMANSIWDQPIEDYIDGTSKFTRTSLNIYRSVWFENALNAPDQLRQRVAFALSEILVVSDEEPAFEKNAEALSYYYDILVKHAFGNYRDLLIDISHSPAMSIYLTYNGSKKHDEVKNNQPDENYARELMQLFSLGLYELKLTGKVKTDENGKAIPTYTQEDVQELSKVFTGWDLYNYEGGAYGHISLRNSDFIHPLQFTADFHDEGIKHVLGRTIGSGQTGDEDIASVVDILMGHKNIAPFVCKHLIKRLVTSNPSGAYVKRVTDVFNDNGQGVKGDLKAVVRAILLDEEARAEYSEESNFGKMKEPLLAYTQLLRSFDVSPYPSFDGSKFNLKDGADGMVTNAYLFSDDLKYGLGQAPTGAPTVFNYFSPDFVPNDPYFQENGLVTPEIEILSAQTITNMSNWFLYDTRRNDRMAEDMVNLYTISYDKEITLVLKALNNNYENMADDSYKENAAAALIGYLDAKLVNNRLGDQRREIIKDHIMSTFYNKNNNGARLMVVDTINLITATSIYMVQR